MLLVALLHPYAGSASCPLSVVRRKKFASLFALTCGAYDCPRPHRVSKTLRRTPAGGRQPGGNGPEAGHAGDTPQGEQDVFVLTSVFQSGGFCRDVSSTA